MFFITGCLFTLYIFLIRIKKKLNELTIKTPHHMPYAHTNNEGTYIYLFY